MAGVVFVFVREDASEAETLAEAFDAQGYSIAGGESAELCVVIWSRRALQSVAFRVAAERALRSGRAVVAALFAPPPREVVFGAPVIDLTLWNGVESAALDPLFEAADDIVHPVEAHVIVLPSRPVFEDAEFTEAPLMISSAESARASAARRAWETPIPAQRLRPVTDAPAAEPKLGAQSPRRDFRRVGARRRKQAGRAHGALAFAVIAILGSGAFVASLVANISAQHAENAKTELSSGVSLTSASADAIGLEDISSDAPIQLGHHGVEPPSARTVRRASYEQ